MSTEMLVQYIVQNALFVYYTTQQEDYIEWVQIRSNLNTEKHRITAAYDGTWQDVMKVGYENYGLNLN